jgi:hypothetical protein
MRNFIAAAVTALALVPLAACNQPAPSANGPAAPAASPGAAPAAPGPLSAADIPHRRPGLWTQVTAMDGPAIGSGMQMCVDADSEARLTTFSQHIPGAQCAPPQLVRNLDGSINVSESCDMGANGKVSTTGVIRGDFNTSYTEQMDSQFSGSPVAQMNGDHKMTITATWTGPCAPGQRGGDIILPNGQVHNLLDDQAARTNAAGN